MNTFLRACLIWLVSVMSIAVTLAPDAAASLSIMDDGSLGSVAAQGLLESDKIVATSITGTPGVDSNLTFYRMGLNATLAFNANFNRLQLGCGGANNALIVGCDVDLSNVSFMGINSSNQACPIGTSTGTCPNGTDFVMTRPYIELAIQNDNTPQRQVVGLNIGSQASSGYLSIGQVYSNGATNLENGVTCSGTNAQCNSGINMFSGYMGTVFTGYVTGRLLLGFIPLGNYYSCFSRSANSNCPGSTPVNGTPSTPVNCTRCSSIATSAQAQTSAVGGVINLNLTANVNEALSFIHGIGLAGVPNFDISFQRQQVAYPTFDKTAFSPTANTGWWMSAPSNVIVNIPGASGPDEQAISTLVADSVTLNNQNLGQTPTSNCYGSYKFC